MNSSVPPYHAVTPARHAASFWKSEPSFAWASREAVVGLVAPEMARAALHLPVAFIQYKDQYLLAAVLGLETGTNLFVAEDGKWTGGYVPALLRGRPFTLLPSSDGKKVLCVDEDAGRVGNTAQPGSQPFFAEEGKLSAPVQQLLDFLSAIESSRQPTLDACAALHAKGLLVPWSIEIKTDSGPRMLEGLYRVDEAAMNALPDDAYLELRRVGAIAMAYAQLMSMPQLAGLGERASARLAQAARSIPSPPVTAGGDLDLSFLERGDTLRF
jgi:hypothetical protein